MSLDLTAGDRAALNRYVSEVRRILKLQHIETCELRLGLNRSDVQTFAVKSGGRIHTKGLDPTPVGMQH